MEQRESKKSDKSFVANNNSPLKKVGEFLREARQSRNLSIEDLSSSIRIGKEQLVALEEGDESSLPERVFIKAMVRRISEKLNLDTSFIFEELNEKEKNEPKYSSAKKKEYTKKNKISNSFILVFLSGILGLCCSIVVLKYIENTQNSSTNQKINYIFLQYKNV